MKETVNPKKKKTLCKKHHQLPYTKQPDKLQHPNFSEHSLDFFSTNPILSGIKPVLDLIEKEPQKIDTIFLQQGLCSKEYQKILDLCRQTNIRFIHTHTNILNRLCLTNHQGIVARLFESGFVELEDLFNKTQQAPLPLIVVLDQIQDPGNAGTIIRTLYALGGVGIIIPKHNGVFLGPDARRAAVGCLEQLPISKATNLSRVLEQADKKGFHIYGSSIEKDSKNVFETQLEFPALLVLGSEKSGVRLQLKKRCHTILHIPMVREVNSLNVAQAGGILISCFSRYQNYL